VKGTRSLSVSIFPCERCNGTNVYWLKKNMGTTVDMIERHYRQTSVLVGAEYETARRWRSRSKTEQKAEDETITTALADPAVLVPEGVVDLNRDDDAED
jgi:hypothetical protein